MISIYKWPTENIYWFWDNYKFLDGSWISQNFSIQIQLAMQYDRKNSFICSFDVWIVGNSFLFADEMISIKPKFKPSIKKRKMVESLLCKMFSCFVNENILISHSVLFILVTILSFMIHRKIITGKNDENAVNNSYPNKQALHWFLFPSHLTTW